MGVGLQWRRRRGTGRQEAVLPGAAGGGARREAGRGAAGGGALRGGRKAGRTGRQSYVGSSPAIKGWR